MLLCEFPDGKNSDRREKPVTACTRLAICTQAEHSWSVQLPAELSASVAIVICLDVVMTGNAGRVKVCFSDM